MTCHKCFKNIIKYWNPGKYNLTTSSVEGLVIITGSANVKYLYNCKNKICSIQISGNTTTTTTPPITGTYIYTYRYNGNFEYTDTNGTIYTGKWNYKCGKICTIFNGMDKNMKLITTGKLIDTKTSTEYLTNIFYKQLGEFNKKYTTSLIPQNSKINTLIFCEEGTEELTPQAEKYLLDNLPNNYSITIKKGDNLEKFINDFDYFILVTTSQFIRDNINIIWENKNKLFVNTWSTVELVRGLSSNLLFNLTTNNQILQTVLFYPDSFTLYDENNRDLFVDDMISRITKAGRPIFNLFTTDEEEIKEINKHLQNSNRVFVLDFKSEPNVFYNKFISYMKNHKKIFLTTYETILSEKILNKLKPYLTGINTCISKATMTPLRNSKWNNIVRKSHVTNGIIHNLSIPSLFPENLNNINEIKDFLTKKYIARDDNWNRGSEYCYYLMFDNFVNLDYNDKNINTTNEIYDKYVEFFDTTLSSVYGMRPIFCSDKGCSPENDIKIITKLNNMFYNNLETIGVTVKNVVEKFYEKYNQGYRLFYFDGSSDTFQKIMNIDYKDAKFICAGVGATVRSNKKPFFYSDENDISRAEKIFNNIRAMVGNEFTVVVDKEELNFLLIKSIHNYCIENGFKFIIYDKNENNLKNLGKYIYFAIFNSYKIKEILNKIDHIEQVKLLITFFYFSEQTFKLLKNINYKGSFASVISPCSSIPFMDSIIGMNSLTETYIDDIIFNLNNTDDKIINFEFAFVSQIILLSYSISHLYKFGFLIDI